MTEPGSTHILQVIHEIKESVEGPHRRRWLENIGYEDGRRARTRRYVDGAVKIMDLLRPEVSSGDIRSYEHLYDEFCELPDTWTGARLDAAKRLWEYVGFLDERTSHERITSVPYEPYHEDTPHSSRRTFGDSPNQRVRFQRPEAAHRPEMHYIPPPYHPPTRHRPAAPHIPTVTHHRSAPHWQYPTTWFRHPATTSQVVAPAKPPAPRPMNIFNGSSWWSGNNYGINWRPTWTPLTEYSRAGATLPYNYNGWAQYLHNNPYTRVWA